MATPNPFTDGQGVPPVVLVFSRAAADPHVLMGALTGRGPEGVRWLWSRVEQLHREAAMPLRQAVTVAMAEAKQEPWTNE